MSASIILQSQSQLKAIYKDAAEIILDNADSTLFLGGRGKNAKDISDNLGRETIDSFNTSENRGTQVSHGLTYQKLGKELMTQERNSSYGRWEMYFAATRCTSLFKRQIRYNETPELQIPFRLRQEKRF